MLGEVCDLIGGGTPPKKTKGYYGGDIPWVTVRDMNVETVTTTDHTITQDGLQNSSSKIIPKGEVIIASRVGLGKVCKLSADMAINQDLKGVVPKKPDSIDRQFLFYWFQSIANHIDANGVGATVKGVKLTFLSALPFPNVAIEEQKRIVAVLDAAFEGLTRAKENAETNLQNARELFESAVSDVFDRTSNDHQSTLGEAVEVLTGFAFKSAGYSEDPADMAMVRGDNIVQGRFRWRNVKRWPRSQCTEYEKYRLDSNDVLLAMDRTWVKDGIKFAIVSKADLPLLLVQRVARLRCLPTLRHDYLGHFIGSKNFERYVLSIQTGIGVPHISGQQIKDCPVYLPEIAAQEDIASKLTDLRSEVEALVIEYTVKLTDIADLRQSLLQKAFAGELT